jgi:hypothetical protein
MSIDRWVMIGDLPKSVIEDLSEFAEENPGPLREALESRGMQATVTLREALEAFLQWNGILGYTAQILCIFDVSKED